MSNNENIRFLDEAVFLPLSGPSNRERAMARVVKFPILVEKISRKNKETLPNDDQLGKVKKSNLIKLKLQKIPIDHTANVSKLVTMMQDLYALHLRFGWKIGVEEYPEDFYKRRLAQHRITLHLPLFGARFSLFQRTLCRYMDDLKEIHVKDARAFDVLSKNCPNQFKIVSRVRGR